jgi:hypothetical protein
MMLYYEVIERKLSVRTPRMLSEELICCYKLSEELVCCYKLSEELICCSVCSQT